MTSRARRTTYVALLRGINLARARRVAMADLRSVIEVAGFEDVRTLLQSGNAVFTGPRQPTADVAETLERAIEKRLSMRVHVVVRTADELADIVAADPLPEAEANGTYLHVLFLARPLTPEERDALDPKDFVPDDVRPADREVYVWYRNGMSG
jgi:uncharacterized protein (DUF1697 family)